MRGRQEGRGEGWEEPERGWGEGIETWVDVAFDSLLSRLIVSACLCFLYVVLINSVVLVLFC